MLPDTGLPMMLLIVAGLSASAVLWIHFSLQSQIQIQAREHKKHTALLRRACKLNRGQLSQALHELHALQRTMLDEGVISEAELLRGRNALAQAETCPTNADGSTGLPPQGRHAPQWSKDWTFH